MNERMESKLAELIHQVRMSNNFLYKISNELESLRKELRGKK